MAVLAASLENRRYILGERHFLMVRRGGLSRPCAARSGQNGTGQHDHHDSKPRRPIKIRLHRHSTHPSSGTHVSDLVLSPPIYRVPIRIPTRPLVVYLTDEAGHLFNVGAEWWRGGSRWSGCASRSTRASGSAASRSDHRSRPGPRPRPTPRARSSCVSAPRSRRPRSGSPRTGALPARTPHGR